MKALNAHTLPLHGRQVIEASAGTGKTWTLAALYLRLVLGHGDASSGFGRELLPPQILVVTFTDAATKELRERIRTRLDAARARSVKLAQSAGCRFVAEPSGLFGWVDTGVDTEVLAQRMLDVMDLLS